VNEITWHDDGHRMILSLTRSEVHITMVVCPHGGRHGNCHHPKYGCIVNWFLMHYGLDCHVGVCAPAEEIQIAWSLVGDPHDVDAGQVWVISVDDVLFSAWASAQRGEQPH
jgi:hypothetical protein